MTCRFTQRAEADLLRLASQLRRALGDQEASLHLSELRAACTRLHETSIGPIADLGRGKYKLACFRDYILLHRKSPEEGCVVVRILRL